MPRTSGRKRSLHKSDSALGSSRNLKASIAFIARWLFRRHALQHMPTDWIRARQRPSDVLRNPRSNGTAAAGSVAWRRRHHRDVVWPSLTCPRRQSADHKRSSSRAADAQLRRRTRIPQMRWRRSERKNGTALSARNQDKAGRDGGVFVDYLQVSCTSRPRERQGHERSALGEDAKNNAVRCEADALRRVQDHRGSLSSVLIWRPRLLLTLEQYKNDFIQYS